MQRFNQKDNNMKVDVYSWEDDEGYINNCMYIDGEEEKYVRPLWDCPEDAVIGRDLIGCE